MVKPLHLIVKSKFGDLSLAIRKTVTLFSREDVFPFAENS